jgi:DDE superfamily endonuclease
MLAETSRPYRAFKVAHQSDGAGPGRKRRRDPTSAVRVNWQNPLLWPTIARAAEIASFGMSPIEISRIAKSMNPVQFAGLTPQVIGTWIDRSGSKPTWKSSVLQRVRHNPGGEVTRKDILTDYPEVTQNIVDHLRKLRIAGVPLDVPRCRGIIIGQLHHAIPEIFETVSKDGSRFRCSESWVRKFLSMKLNWTMRSGTRAAQKLPANVDEVCREQFLRLALTLRDGVIDHPAFLVNIDQTNIIYQATNSSTYEEKGSKQVSIVGQEEKRAFTLVVGISAAGHLLPFQAIYGGKTQRSVPSNRAARRAEADALGIKLEFSNTDTYWSTFDLMCKYVDTILVPYWMRQKEIAKVSPDQECVLQLDVWVVHRSIAFRTWLDKNWPWIKYRFVPAGTTGVAQPCDVGIQRPLKQIIRRCQNADIVEETLVSLRAGVLPLDVRIDTSVVTLRDRSVGWLVTAYDELNHPDIIKKVMFIP